MKEDSVAINSHLYFSSKSKYAWIVRFHDRITMYGKPGFRSIVSGSYIAYWIHEVAGFKSHYSRRYAIQK